MEQSWSSHSPILSSHLPSQIIAPQGLSELLTHGSYDKVKKPMKKIIKKYTTPIPTTRPPIVWFPGDPDCNDTAPSRKSMILNFEGCSSWYLLFIFRFF